MVVLPVSVPMDTAKVSDGVYHRGSWAATLLVEMATRLLSILCITPRACHAVNISLYVD